MSEGPRWESVREEGVDSQVGQQEDRRARSLERPLHLVTQAHWRPVRAKVNPEGHSLVGKGKPGGDLKFMAESLQKG